MTLRSITTPDLGFLAPLQNLQSLDIKLGGIRSSGESMNCCTSEFSPRSLACKNLFLQSLPHIASLPSLANAASLRRVNLRKLTAMRDFGALEHAPALEEFSLPEGRGLTPERLLPVLRNPALRRIFANFCGDRKNRDFACLRDAHGKLALDPWASFAYR